eukprot:TRINITY_DN1259_c0_g1_i12.p1 TRINITY_DN1259_c0_g1~~TRINITY_DN1259_c0_g1_i12.p1  ORF type:complete len:358 (-),score=107.91 TRINITY_DN1259_c0_g1_i12:50-1123(-)
MELSEALYQEGGIHHPDAVAIDITKHPKVGLREISKVTGWWSDEGVLGLEIEHGAVSVKGLCESPQSKPPHSASLKMADGEYLTVIAGQTTDKIERLTFRTSRGTMITFGNDKPEGSSFILSHKNHKVAAISLGIAKHVHFIGAYFVPVIGASPALVPQQEITIADKMSLDGEEEKWYKKYPKAIEYKKMQALPMADVKALADPETYGRFNDFEWAIKNPIKEKKKVWIKEIMLYYSTVKRFVLGYRLKYEIKDPKKTTGKIVELKHVAPNPFTPTMHVHQMLDENEFLSKVSGRRNKDTKAITYLALTTNSGKCIEIGEKEGDEEFVLEGEKEKNVIALAGKVTDALNELSIYCIQ